jgi:hypothetical protein
MFSWRTYGKAPADLTKGDASSIGAKFVERVTSANAQKMKRRVGYLTVLYHSTGGMNPDDHNNPNYWHVLSGQTMPLPGATTSFTPDAEGDPLAPDDTLSGRIAPLAPPTPPVELSNAAAGTSIVAVSGTMPQVTADSYTAGSEGTSFALGRFAYKADDDTVITRVLIVPMASHPMHPVKLTFPTGARQQTIAIAPDSFMAFTVITTNGSASQPVLDPSPTQPLQNYPLYPTSSPNRGPTTNQSFSADEDAAEWLIRRVLVAKSIRGVN